MIYSSYLTNFQMQGTLYADIHADLHGKIREFRRFEQFILCYEEFLLFLSPSEYNL